MHRDILFGTSSIPKVWGSLGLQGSESLQLVYPVVQKVLLITMHANGRRGKSGVDLKRCRHWSVLNYSANLHKVPPELGRLDRMT